MYSKEGNLNWVKMHGPREGRCMHGSHLLDGIKEKIDEVKVSGLVGWVEVNLKVN